MSAIDKTAPVMVTGATGYVAGWLVKRLLDDGLTVHAAVRDPDNTEKLKHLIALANKAPGEIKFFKSDLLTAGSYDQAMQYCELVFHTASPFQVSVEDKQRDLIDPAVKGTANVLESANRCESVKRVVITGSTAAIYGDNADIGHTGTGAFSEKDWNTTSSINHQTYQYSKVLAEKKAWALAEQQSNWDLVVVNPTFVLGPAIDPQSSGESISTMIQFGDGTMKAGAPDIGLGLIDVRDLAEVHFKAGFEPSAHGRYLASAHNSSFLQMAKILREAYGDSYPIPKRAIPKWLLWLIGPMVSKGVMTRKIVSRNVNLPWRGDNGKVVNELGVAFRPEQETLKEMFQQLIDAGRLSTG